MNLLTTEEEIELFKELESLRRQIDLLSNGITKWKLKVLHEHNESLDKTLKEMRRRYVWIKI